MKITILNNAKKKRILGELEEFGLKKIPEILIQTGKENLRAYSGNLNSEGIYDLWRLLPVEGIGLYVGKERIDRHGIREVRMSIDALHLWKKQITKKILVLSEAQEEEWFRGKNLELNNQELREFVAVKSADGKDFIGTGKISADGKTLFNFLPKERRRKGQII